MNGENEREEYSGEMIVGEGREKKEKKEKREEKKPLPLEEEVARIFSEESSEAPAASRLPAEVEKKEMPVRKEAKKKELPQAPEAQKKEAPVREKTAPKPQKKKASAAHYAAILLLLLLASVAVVVFGVTVAKRYPGSEGAPAEDTDAPLPTGEEKLVFVYPYGDAEGVLSLPELYEKYADAVVSVRTQGKSGSGIGTGFFLRKDGYLATVAHVVSGADTISVLTGDGKSHAASLVAMNEMSDLALLKIEGEDYPCVELGASGELLTGERVVTIGTPASPEYAGSLCTGEISYSLRTVRIYDGTGQGLQKKMKLMQTNLSLNPGNSGSPVFDSYGRVVGIVTMRLGDGMEGIGFAIPSDGASAILGAMMRGERLTEELVSLVSVSAPQLGILGETGESEGIAGVKILRFSSNTCDAAIKLRTGDLIVGMEGEPIATTEQMQRIVQSKSPGESVFVTVLRAGQRLTFEVVLEKS